MISNKFSMLRIPNSNMRPRRPAILILAAQRRNARKDEFHESTFSEAPGADRTANQQCAPILNFEFLILSSATSAKDSAASAFDPEFLRQSTQSLSQRSQRGSEGIGAADQGSVEVPLPLRELLRGTGFI